MTYYDLVRSAVAWRPGREKRIEGPSGRVTRKGGGAWQMANGRGQVLPDGHQAGSGADV